MFFHLHLKLTSMSMRRELKAFIMKGSAVDLAVAAVIGAAFDAIV